MVAGFLVISIVAGLGSAVMALILGQALWVVALAYMLGGMLGVSLGLIWGCLWARIEHWRSLAQQHNQQHGHWTDLTGGPDGRARSSAHPGSRSFRFLSRPVPFAKGQV